MAAPLPDRPPHALVVDDDDILRMDVSDLLAGLGFRTLEAADGDAAILMLEQRHLDVTLLFSDVEMPGSRDGFALAREVAAKWPAISIVVASGRLRPHDGDMPAGARFIGKPFSAETVHGHLREIMPEGRKPEGLRS
ncbi:response regulator [Lichenibacterium dinghuense]|uniref:response regulator n=1 Tax=Lichenibacterium dinghuense TaxID=2895977 RepID=UPI001F00AFD9|nr:response regulator [Lichenibacterium sp. 6Y81]